MFLLFCDLSIFCTFSILLDKAKRWETKTTRGGLVLSSQNKTEIGEWRYYLKTTICGPNILWFNSSIMSSLITTKHNQKLVCVFFLIVLLLWKTQKILRWLVSSCSKRYVRSLEAWRRKIYLNQTESFWCKIMQKEKMVILGRIQNWARVHVRKLNLIGVMMGGWLHLNLPEHTRLF